MGNLGIPTGTRDFGPAIMIKRNFILDTIKSVFKKYGFLPLETPAMENLSVLTGKYGEEGDRLIFKVLNSGEKLTKATADDLNKGWKSFTSLITEKGLRYDLTVPFARYVVMNRNSISFPFKRYQVQPVWRGDRPQKGRYREFYQCDADVVGTDSLICEAEIVLMIAEAFANLGLKDYTIKINNRKILEGMAAMHGQLERLTDLTVAIDKLDKIGKDKVAEELVEKGFETASAKAIMDHFTEYQNKKNTEEKIAFLKQEFERRNIEAGLKGVEEIGKVYEYVRLATSRASVAIVDKLEFDVSLARGLSYYTGAIFEVKANNVSIGSICGGGRYDNLTGVFGLPGVSGVGISFGVDRIYDVMEELKLFPENTATSTRVLIGCFDEAAERYSLPVLYQLREAGINSELFPEAGKPKKPLNYANNKNIPYVILVGSDEMASGELTVKDMLKGEQQRLSINKIIEKLR